MQGTSALVVSEADGAANDGADNDDGCGPVVCEVSRDPARRRSGWWIAAQCSSPDAARLEPFGWSS
jgi:hypothetical protein